MRKGVLIGIVLIVVIIISVIAILLSLERSSENETSCGNSEPCLPSDEIQKCEKDIDCFIDRSKDCSLASWYLLAGATHEIRGMRDGNCWVYRQFMNDECPFEIEDLTAMLERWKEGIYSTEDWVTCN